MTRDRDGERSGLLASHLTCQVKRSRVFSVTVTGVTDHFFVSQRLPPEGDKEIDGDLGFQEKTLWLPGVPGSGVT